MAVTAAQVTVTTTAAALSATETDARSGEILVVLNTDATNPVYLGPVGVTSGTGFKLPAGGSTPALHLGAGESLYAVSGGSVVVHVLRLGN